MKFKQSLILGLLAGFLSFGLTACDEGITGQSVTCDPACGEAQECVQGECRDKDVSEVPECQPTFTPICVGQVATSCVDGKWQKEDCEDKGLVCAKAACIKVEIPEGECDNDYVPECIGSNKVTACIEDEIVTVDCGSNETCEKGVCREDEDIIEEPECTSASKPECVDASTAKVCVEEAWSTVNCEEEEVCNDGECVPANVCEPECDNATQDCVNGTCQNKVDPKTAIGNACQCSGEDCTFTIDLDKLEGLVELKESIDLIKSMKFGVMTVPNFFAESIKGCQNVEAPEGMKVGCLRDDSITIPEQLIAISKLLIAFNIIPSIDGVDLEAIVSQLEGGLPIASKKGYCFVGAIDAKAETEATSGMPLYLKKTIDEVGEILAAGNPQEAGECPSGTERISYLMESTENASAPAMETGVVVCLKTCRTNDDCRVADGYECTDVPSEDKSYKKVCLDPTNVETFSAFIP